MKPWTGIKGMSRWLAALARGDQIDEGRATSERLSHCRECPTLAVRRVPLLGLLVGTCGRDETPTSCGCVMGYVDREASAQLETIAGGDKEKLARLVRANMKPAGAALVASKGCIQGKFPPIPVTVNGEPVRSVAGCCGQSRRRADD